MAESVTVMTGHEEVVMGETGSETIVTADLAF